MSAIRARKNAGNRRFDPDHLRTRDILVLVPLIILGMGLFIALGARFGHDAAIKWGGLVIDSSVLFAFLLYDSREHFRRHYFWALTGIFAVFHFLGWVALLAHVEKWGLLSFGLMAFEAPVFIYLRNRPEI
jgi:hypothetical protein